MRSATMSSSNEMCWYFSARHEALQCTLKRYPLHMRVKVYCMHVCKQHGLQVNNNKQPQAIH